MVGEEFAESGVEVLWGDVELPLIEDVMVSTRDYGWPGDHYLGFSTANVFGRVDRWVALPYEFVEVGEVVGGHGLRRREGRDDEKGDLNTQNSRFSVPCSPGVQFPRG